MPGMSRIVNVFIIISFVYYLYDSILDGGGALLALMFIRHTSVDVGYGLICWNKYCMIDCVHMFTC